jgi:hypothetical protein
MSETTTATNVVSGETVRDECAICLGTVEKPGKIDSCIHEFCFDCILKWSNVTNKCPICAKKFKSIKEVIAEAVQQAPLTGKKRKKPAGRTVKVANKEQHVSYEYTGTFGNDSDSDDDDYDSYFYSDSSDEGLYLYSHSSLSIMISI